MPNINFDIQGLNAAQVIESRRKYGSNTIKSRTEYPVFNALSSLAKEPMVLLLLVAAIIYFVSGKTGDGIFLAVAIVLVSIISLYQDSRSRNALEKLKTFSQPNCKVIREGKVESIKSSELVVGDSMMVEEGTLITADGTIVHSNDFSVNESVLTGESFPVNKSKSTDDHIVFHGTAVTSGLAIATITAIGADTRLAKIGQSIENIETEKTPLEQQIHRFVTKMVIAGAVVFVIVWAINFWHSGHFADSLLKALTLAMSILPEEIPVAFTTFMALGAWRLMKMGIIVKQMKTVETLGGATVICTDKTGTLTENKMTLARLFLLSTQKITQPGGRLSDEEKQLMRVAMFASEPIPFDPMEIALHQAYGQSRADDERPLYKMIHEYPLGGKPPMMTHIFENIDGTRIVAAKGAPEALIAVSHLTPGEKQRVEAAIELISNEGYRVLAVAEAVHNGNVFPEQQQQFEFKFIGLVAFYDPPKKNIGKVLREFEKAGIEVKIVTGDNAETTAAIAQQVGFKGFEKSVSGSELLKLDDAALKQKVLNTHVFNRMFPDAKLKIIEALKSVNEIVAMTGDGVNDGPALKSAHIGIAMGKKGTEIAKDAASLILLEDDLSKMVDAIAMGRRIYTNLKKAIRYIISIHIPIVLTVFLPLALGWVYPNIFSPVHIIFLELIMGPTCSIIYENEPMEKNTMSRKPRAVTSNFFNSRELGTSIIQGLAITFGALLVYQYAVYCGFNEAVTRTMVFTVLISANMVLTLVNRSFYYSVFATMSYKNNLVTLILGITLVITALLIYVEPLARFFGFQALGIFPLLLSLIVGKLSVIWYELVKLQKRNRPGNRQ